MALPEHLKKLVSSKGFEKRYKKLQYNEGVKHFGEEHTQHEMKEKYSSKGKALSKAKK